MAYRLEPSGFAEFDDLAALFLRTLRLLDRVAAGGDLPDGAADLLANETLPHIEDVEAGFRAWLRAGDSDLGEMRALVLQGGLGIQPARDEAERRAALAEAIQARAGAGGSRDLAYAGWWRLTALAHARLVFALIPHTPAPEVRFPRGRPSYADIYPPRGPGELALRIEELERELWWLAAGRPPRPTRDAYRRTFGFFDVAERLVGRGFRGAN
jgi:hypothetical protein